MRWGWLNNAWIIGIGTGIASGLLVTWIAKFFLSKKEDREYQQRIGSANREVIYAIRPGISEGQKTGENRGQTGRNPMLGDYIGYTVPASSSLRDVAGAGSATGN